MARSEMYKEGRTPLHTFRADIDYALNAPWRVVTTVSPKAGMELVYPGIPHTNNDAIFAVSSNSKIYLSGLNDYKKTLPSLLKFYLRLGGKVSDHAVIDRDLNTIHVFTYVRL